MHTKQHIINENLNFELYMIFEGFIYKHEEKNNKMLFKNELAKEINEIDISKIKNDKNLLIEFAKLKYNALTNEYYLVVLYYDFNHDQDILEIRLLDNYELIASFVIPENMNYDIAFVDLEYEILYIYKEIIETDEDTSKHYLYNLCCNKIIRQEHLLEPIMIDTFHYNVMDIYLNIPFIILGHDYRTTLYNYLVNEIKTLPILISGSKMLYRSFSYVIEDNIIALLDMVDLKLWLETIDKYLIGNNVRFLTRVSI